MAYRPKHDYRSKDALERGDPNKRVMGRELSEDFEAISADLKNVHQELTNENGEIGDLHIQVDANAEAIKDINLEIDGIKVDVESNADAIKDINLEIDTINENITNIEGDVAGNKTEINNLRDDFDNHEHALDDLSDVTSNNPDRDDLLIWNGTNWVADDFAFIQTALRFKGGIAPTANAPANPEAGDLYVFDADGTLNASWGVLSGVAVTTGKFVGYAADTHNRWYLLGNMADTGVMKVSPGTAIEVDDSKPSEPVVSVDRSELDTWYPDKNDVEADLDWVHNNETNHNLILGWNPSTEIYHNDQVLLGNRVKGQGGSVAIGADADSKILGVAIGSNAKAGDTAVAIGEDAAAGDFEFAIGKYISAVNFSNATVQAKDYLDADGNSIIGNHDGDIANLQGQINNNAGDISALRNDFDNHDHALDDLSDVSASNPTKDDLLIWNGSSWSADNFDFIQTALNFKGSTNVAQAAPSAEQGDLYVNNTQGTAAASWTGISGTVVNAGNFIGYANSRWYLLGEMADIGVTDVVQGLGISVDDSKPSEPVVSVDRTETDKWYADKGHNHSGVYEPVISPKNSAFNKNFAGSGSAATVSRSDHTHSQYLESYTETDPTVPGHVKSISTTNISNWNSAHSWGNHGSQGYLKSETVSAGSGSTVSDIKIVVGKTGTDPNTLYFVV